MRRVVLVEAFGAGRLARLSYLLTLSTHFTVGETSGVVHTTERTFDREQQSTYELLIEVRHPYKCFITSSFDALNTN